MKKVRLSRDKETGVWWAQYYDTKYDGTVYVNAIVFPSRKEAKIFARAFTNGYNVAMKEQQCKLSNETTK